MVFSDKVSKFEVGLKREIGRKVGNGIGLRFYNGGRMAVWQTLEVTSTLVNRTRNCRAVNVSMAIRTQPRRQRLMAERDEVGLEATASEVNRGVCTRWMKQTP